MVVLFFFVALSGGNGADAPSSSFRGGQAQHLNSVLDTTKSDDSVVATGGGDDSYGDVQDDDAGDADDYGTDDDEADDDEVADDDAEPAVPNDDRVAFNDDETEEEDVMELVKEDLDDLEVTAKEELIYYDYNLEERVSVVVESTRKQLTDLIADSDILDSDDVNALCLDLEKKLTEQSQTLAYTETEEIVETEQSALEVEAEYEIEDAEVEEEDWKDVEEDLDDVEKRLKLDLQDEIASKIHQIEDDLPQKAALLAKELLEAKLKEKTTYTYIVTIENDVITSFQRAPESTAEADEGESGDDEVLHQADNADDSDDEVDGEIDPNGDDDTTEGEEGDFDDDGDEGEVRRQ